MPFFRQKLYGEFELMGVPEQKLCSQHWQNVHQRMQTEEAACQLAGGEAEENGYVIYVFYVFFLLRRCCVNQLVICKLHFSKILKVKTLINLLIFFSQEKKKKQPELDEGPYF